MNSHIDFIQKLTVIKFMWIRLIVIPLIILSIIIATFACFDIDKQLAAFLAKQPGGFPFASSDVYEFWFHRFPKIISGTVFIGMLSLAILLIPVTTWLEKIPNAHWKKTFSRFTTLSAVIKSRYWLNNLPKNTRAALWLTILAIVFSSEMIGHLKRNSSVYCPIKVQAYGGTEAVPLSAIKEPFPTFGPNGGQCWPGGHSITGFIFEACFFGFYFLGMQRAAWVSLSIALVYGNFLGLTQVIRGQHYLSHQIWSAFFCWMFSLMVFWFAEKIRNKLSQAKEKATG